MGGCECISGVAVGYSLSSKSTEQRPTRRLFAGGQASCAARELSECVVGHEDGCSTFAPHVSESESVASLSHPSSTFATLVSDESSERAEASFPAASCVQDDDSPVVLRMSLKDFLADDTKEASEVAEIFPVETDIKVPELPAAEVATVPNHSPHLSSWWDHQASVTTDGLAPLSRVLDVLIIKDSASPQPAQWEAGQSDELYWEMGMRDPAKTYVASWTHINNVSILSMSELVDVASVDSIFAEAKPVMKRLKLIIQPVKSRLPLPKAATTPAGAYYVGEMLGERGCGAFKAETKSGIKYICVHADFNAKWLLKQGVLRAGFQSGNILDMLVVDWPGSALVCGGRLVITPEFLQHVNS